MVAAQSLSNAYHAFASREGNWKDKECGHAQFFTPKLYAFADAFIGF
jgi:hypothetical protein